MDGNIELVSEVKDEQEPFDKVHLTRVIMHDAAGDILSSFDLVLPNLG